MCYMWAAYAALTAVSAYQASNQRKATAKYQSQVAERNMEVANLQAKDAVERGNKQAAEVRRKYAGLVGTQRASLAARGLDISDGSANATLQDTVYFGDVDQQTVKSNAAREAWGYQVRAANFQGDAGAYMATSNAENPLLNAGMAAGGTLFSGGESSVANKWLRGGQTISYGFDTSQPYDH